jgi:hypothetical protein
MAIVQVDVGFPFLGEAVYEYITKGKFTGIAVPVPDLPESLKDVVQRVSARGCSVYFFLYGRDPLVH